MRSFMRKPHECRRLLFGKKNKRDDRGSAIVIVIIAMALIGILASTILWSSYLNYRIKINDMKVKNSFYSAETVVEQVLAGVKKNIVSASINEAYQEVLSNWDALGTDDNRQSYFVTAFVDAVKKKLDVQSVVGATGVTYTYDRDVIKDYVDKNLWEGGPGNDPATTGYIVVGPWNTADAVFVRAEDNGYRSMSIRNICVEFYDSEGLLSIINTDIAIDVPSLRFTQAGTIDRLYPYVLVGDDGIMVGEPANIANVTNVTIDGSIYGGVDDAGKGGIQIVENSSATVENAAYVISGGDIVVGNSQTAVNSSEQHAKLTVRDYVSGGVGYQTNVYAQGLAVNGSHLDISGRTYVANDLTLSGISSDVSLLGHYFGYGDYTGRTHSEEVPAEGGGTEQVTLNPAAYSSAIVINGKDSTLDLTGLNTLQLAGRAYVSLTENEGDNLPHVMMGESISVKSNQIAYLVPAECVGTVSDGTAEGRTTVIGQNPMAFNTWTKMIGDLKSGKYTAEDQFRLVDATKPAAKLGGKNLSSYGVHGITAGELAGVDTDDILNVSTGMNAVGTNGDIRFLYKDSQVYMYLVMEKEEAAQYFTQYYNVNSNKDSLVKYFNLYATGGINIGDNVQGYTVLGNSMISRPGGTYGDHIVELLASVTPASEDDEEGEDSPPGDNGTYQEVSDNVTKVENARDDLASLAGSARVAYRNLNKTLLENDDGSEDTVFENLILLGGGGLDLDGTGNVGGLQEYLDSDWDKDATGAKDGVITFEAGGLKAVLVDSSKQPGNTYIPNDSNIRLVIATGDVKLEHDFRGMIIANGTITIAGNVTCTKDGEGVYNVLQAKNKDNVDDPNVPANVLANGSGMMLSGYESANVDSNGNLNINYSEIVRYENWVKK